MSEQNDAQNPLTPVALAGVPAPRPVQPEDGKTLSAIELLSGRPIPAPSPAKAKVKTLSQIAAEVFAEGAE